MKIKDSEEGGTVMTEHEFAEAYNKHFKGTIRFLVSRGASQDDAQEFAQAAWARGWERIGQLRDPSIINFWICRIALNLYKDKFLGAITISLTDEIGPVREMRNDKEIDLYTILGLCRSSDRDLLIRAMAGETMEEMAESEGKSLLAMRKQLFMIRQNLRRLANEKNSVRTR